MSLYSSLTQVLAPFAAKINGLLTGWDGTKYSTPGEAVRQQIADLHVLIGDEPGTAISASAISYGESDVETALDGVNGRLDAIENKGNGLTDEVKQALLTCFRHVAVWDDIYGQTYVSALEAALYPPAELLSIVAKYTQSGPVYDNWTLDSLKEGLVVTANYDDGTSKVLTTYALSGTLEEGTSTITVAYGGKTATFNVTVTHIEIIDYTEDAVSGAEWSSGAYNSSTGAVIESQGDYYTPKFDVQDCTYDISCSDTSASYLALYKWDENEKFLGGWQVNGRNIYRVQVKPNCKYALKIHHDGTFDPTTVTMMPVDKTATQTNMFSIDLTERLEDITLINNGNPKYGGVIGQIVITDDFANAGIPLLTGNGVYEYINRMSFPGALESSEAGLNTGYRFSDDFKIAILYWNGKYYMQISSYGILTLQDLKDYISANNIVVTFNY